jgi:hypothetical protein
MRFEQILEELAKLQPGARAALELRVAGERALMKALKNGGLPAVARLVVRLNAAGHRFEVTQSGAGHCYWGETLGSRRFDIHIQANRHLTSASLHYLAVPKVKPLTPAQQRRQGRQERFYERYMDIGQRAYGGKRINALERTLLLVGELEADVNNGGFSQYLDNKGRRRAADAVRALQAIGASRTAAMLKKALASGENLDALDDRFYAGVDDLAVLGERYFSARASGGRRGRAARAR